MQRFVTFLLLAVLLPAVAMSAKYDGMWKFESAVDEAHAPVTIPGSFSVVVRSESDERYALSVRVGNSMRADMRVQAGQEGAAVDHVHIGDCMSTMMMPPENLFKFEQFLTTGLPKMQTITLSEDGNKMILEGASKITLSKE